MNAHQTSARARKALLLATFAVLLASPWLAGCATSAPASAALPTPKVTVAQVITQETIDSDEYTGKTEASDTVEVRARVFGYLKSVEFRDGDFVKGPVIGPSGEIQEEGQVLFTIEPDEYQAIHKQALSRIDLNKANLELANAKLARNKKLLEGNNVSREEYEESVAAAQEAQARITAAIADAERTALDVKYTTIRAPISGRIDRNFVSVGNLLTGGQSSGTLLTKIVSEQPMYVYFDVDESSLLRYMRQRAATRDTAPGSLRDLGIPIYLKLSDEDDFVHEGVLDFIETEVNLTTGTARLRGVFDNKNRELASGLFVRVQIPVSQPYQALLIPEVAIATDQSIQFVYVVGADGTATRRPVELGPQRGELRIVKSRVEAGDKVIVKGLQRVKPGQKVDAEEAPATAPPTTVRKLVSETTGTEPTEPVSPTEPSGTDNPPRRAKER